VESCGALEAWALPLRPQRDVFSGDAGRTWPRLGMGRPRYPHRHYHLNGFTSTRSGSRIMSSFSSFAYYLNFYFVCVILAINKVMSRRHCVADSLWRNSAEEIVSCSIYKAPS
jgi:hypothetical protein